MGVGASTRNRYIGGKGFLKYFKEDVWPLVEAEFTFVQLNQLRGFELFTAFAKADANENGLISSDEAFHCFGGRRTKFTERIFQSDVFIDDDLQQQQGLKFREFAIRLWNYCTLDNAGLARFVFEIMDVDNHDMLEEADIKTMYRFLFDSEEYDEEYIALYNFSEYQKIFKSNFMKITAREPVLIQPAIDYQQLLQKKIGGKKMWLSLGQHRAKNLWNHDEHSLTLRDAVESIFEEAVLVAEKSRAPTADILLLEKQASVTEQLNLAEQELRLQERQKESERRMKAVTAPDRKMHQAWSIFAAQRQEFIDEEYLIDDLERRCTDRNELFHLFDCARKESIAYWEWKDEQDVKYVMGTDADHEARYQDYLKTEEGAALRKLVSLIRVLEIMEKSFIAKLKSNVPTDGSKKSKKEKKTQKHKLVEGYLQTARQVLDGIREEDVDKKEKEKRWRLLINRNLDEELDFVKSNAKKAQKNEADEVTHKELCAELKGKTLLDLEIRLKDSKEEREKDLIRKEFDIITNFGSRTTKWEYVLDKEQGRMLYVHRDTLEQRHAKTAICEYCDAILVQHELRCDGCNAKRSAKNLRLFRPLGFKDITQE